MWRHPTLALVVIAMFMVTLTIDANGADPLETYMLETTRKEQKSILSMAIPDALYQDHGVLFYLILPGIGETSIKFSVINGEIVGLDEYDIERIIEYPDEIERYRGQQNGDLLTPSDMYHDLVAYAIYPEYLDEDFEMVLAIEVLNGTEILFTEIHTFRVTGKPIVIEGYDLSDGIDIPMTYVKAVIVSIVIWALVIAIAILIRKNMKGGEN